MRAFALGVTGALSCLAGLALLPGRTTQYVSVPLEEASQPPGSGGFVLGSLHWQLETYRRAPELAALRAFFDETCGGRRGLEAATCVSDRFARAFAHGVPTREFLGPAYDPSTDLVAHMKGEPGHCVTRSGLVSAVLLSAGLPARQVQLVVRNALGHNALEVWDERFGWSLFDPTYGTALTGARGPIGAAAVVAGVEAGQWKQLGLAPDMPPAARFHLRADGNLSLRYPDPWLYLRQGAPAASWPYRGRVVTVGNAAWDGGPAQNVLRSLTAFFLALAAAAAAIFVRGRRQASEHRAVDALVCEREDKSAA